MTAHTVLEPRRVPAPRRPRRHNAENSVREITGIDLPGCPVQVERHEGALIFTGTHLNTVVNCPGWALAEADDGAAMADWLARRCADAQIVLDPLGQLDRIPATAWRSALMRATTLCLSVADATRLVMPGADRSLLARLHARLASSTIVLLRRADASCLLIGGAYHFPVDVPAPPRWAAAGSSGPGQPEPSGSLDRDHHGDPTAGPIPPHSDPLGARHAQAYALFRACGADPVAAAGQASLACAAQVTTPAG